MIGMLKLQICLNLKGEVMKKIRAWSFGIGTCMAWILNMMAYAQQTTYPAGNASMPQQPNYSTGSQTNSVYSAGSQQNQTLRIGLVNTKKCLEESKLGKQEQANFEKM
jgi:outer membrane protein